MAELTEWQAGRAVKWYEDGLDIDEIAILLGRSEDTIRAAVEGTDKPARRTKRADRDTQYREGFEAGYRMALSHANIHGIEQAREYCNYSLLPWRKSGPNDIPPEFLRIHGRP